MKGTARYRGSARKQGYCWGALDVMLPHAPIRFLDVVSAAVAITYLHVLYVDGDTLRRLSEAFPEARWAMRKWTLITGAKEYLLKTPRCNLPAWPQPRSSHSPDARRVAGIPVTRIVRSRRSGFMHAKSPTTWPSSKKKH